MTMQSNRLLHITHPKCGSQWVKDVLAAPEIVNCSGLPYSGITLNLGGQLGADLPSNAFSGPIYCMNQWEWMQWKRPRDRALVVLRDPRDILISLMFSWLYSHSAPLQIEVRRRGLLNMPGLEERVESMIGSFALGARMFRTWASNADGSALVVRYEALLADQRKGFAEIFTWLGWAVTENILDLVVGRLDFQARSGRQRGQQDNFSHYRRGVAGDWRNYFSRANGQLMENIYPEMLCALGYEKDTRWWQSLPEKSTHNAQDGDVATADQAPDAQFLAAVQQRNRVLEHELEEKESVIRKLDQECQARLQTIQTFNGEVNRLSVECEQRMSAIQALDDERKRLLCVCQERLEVIQALNEKIAPTQT